MIALESDAIFEKNTMLKNLRKKYYPRSKLPDFWFSCSLHASLNISPFATKSIWENLQEILLMNCWIWTFNLDINCSSLWGYLLKLTKFCKAFVRKKERLLSRDLQVKLDKFHLTSWDKKYDRKVWYNRKVRVTAVSRLNHLVLTCFMFLRYS